MKTKNHDKILWERIKSKLLTRNFFYIILLIIYFSIVIIFMINDVITAKSRVLNEVDNKLKWTVNSVQYIIGREFHDSIKNKNSISDSENKLMTEKLTAFVNDFNLKYVYSMVKVKNKIYFSASSLTEQEKKANKWPVFFEEYFEASEDLKEIFIKGGDFIEEQKDRWGEFRSYLKAFKTRDGKYYVIGADAGIGDINNLFFKSIMRSVVFMIIFIIVLFPLFYLYYVIKKKEEEEIIYKMNHDNNTLLPKREVFLSEVLETLNPIIFIINVNYFKEINDFYGYENGDKILKDITERIENIPIAYKISAFKFSGDEFALLLNEKLEKTDLELLARYYFEEITTEPYFIDKDEIFISVSIGVSSYHDIDFDNIKKDLIGNKLIGNANIALERAKETKKQFVIYDRNVEKVKKTEMNRVWANKILSAIKEQRIIPFFQPIRNNENNHIEKYEVLVRMIDKDGSVISPYIFLGASKKYHLYNHITRIMIQKAFAIFEELEYEFSINISIDDILDIDTMDILKKRLEEYKGANRVVFELLESEGIDNYEIVKNFIDEVKKYGCKIAIDDFGSGYSNFEHILKLNVDYLKIDASMIKNISQDKNSELITSTIVSFAKKMNIKTIAEFVHSEDVNKKVIEIGVDYSQGYYIGEPKKILLKDK